MFPTFFLTDLPPNIAEPTLRKLLRDDLSVSVSFRDSPAGTVAMVEARGAQEAQRAAVELAQTTLGGGTPLTVVAPDTPEGQQLRLIFAFSQEREQRACGRCWAYSACVLIVDDDPMCLVAVQKLLSLHLPHVCVHVADSGYTAVELNGTREFDAILSCADTWTGWDFARCGNQTHQTTHPGRLDDWRCQCDAADSRERRVWVYAKACEQAVLRERPAACH